MTTRTIRCWAVLLPLALVLSALADPNGWLEAAAGIACVLGVAVIVVTDGLRERGMPRRR
jgi:hypothetical protein